MNTIITETTEHGEMPLDVYQKLADDRILFITDELSDELATDITATLLLKDNEDDIKKISLFINSAGGNIRNAFMIVDMMNVISAPVETVCIGEAIDEAALILASGTPGMRLATKNAVVGVSQLVQDWHAHANLTDAKIYMDLLVNDNKRMMETLSKATGKTISQVSKDLERRVWLNSQQAMRYGLIDKVVRVNK